MVVRLQNMMRSHCEEALSLLTADAVDQGGVTAHRRNDTVGFCFGIDLKFITLTLLCFYRSGRRLHLSPGLPLLEYHVIHHVIHHMTLLHLLTTTVD